MTGRHRAPELELELAPEPEPEPDVIRPPRHPSWWTPRRRAAAGAACLAVVVASGLVVAPEPQVPTEQLLTAEKSADPTGRAGAVRVLPEYTPPVIPIIGAEGAWDPDAAEPDCGRCGDREPPEATTPPAEPVPAPTRDEPAPPPDPPPDPQSGETAGLLELVNRDRLANGCGPVAVHADLMRQSQAHAERQAADDAMYHSGGVDGFGTWGENVAVGYFTAAEVHEAWMNSPGHRANILDCDFTLIGYGAAGGPSGRYWAEQFAA